jgi:hypothetical protein
MEYVYCYCTCRRQARADRKYGGRALKFGDTQEESNAQGRICIQCKPGRHASHAAHSLNMTFRVYQIVTPTVVCGRTAGKGGASSWQS